MAVGGRPCRTRRGRRPRRRDPARRPPLPCPGPWAPYTRPTYMRQEGDRRSGIVAGWVGGSWRADRALTRTEGPSLAARLAGGIWGHLVGDAAGVPYEFMDPIAVGEVVFG